jgi:hypothetical protein
MPAIREQCPIWLSLSSIVAMPPEVVLPAVVRFSTSARVAASISLRNARSKAGEGVGGGGGLGLDLDRQCHDAHSGQGDTSDYDTGVPVDPPVQAASG